MIYNNMNNKNNKQTEKENSTPSIDESIQVYLNSPCTMTPEEIKKIYLDPSFDTEEIRQI